MPTKFHFLRGVLLFQILLLCWKKYLSRSFSSHPTTDICIYVYIHFLNTWGIFIGLCHNDYAIICIFTQSLILVFYIRYKHTEDQSGFRHDEIGHSHGSADFDEDFTIEEYTGLSELPEDQSQESWIILTCWRRGRKWHYLRHKNWISKGSWCLSDRAANRKEEGKNGWGITWLPVFNCCLLLADAMEGYPVVVIILQCHQGSISYGKVQSREKKWRCLWGWQRCEE